MIHPAQWAQMKVGDFFRGYNWQGSPPVLECSVTEESLDNLPSLVCLSVADFFSQGNWTGQQSRPGGENLPTLHRPKAPPQPLSITASVADFCRGFQWQGRPLSQPLAIANSSPTKLEQLEQKAPVTKLEPAIGLEDLSDLF
ncbi:hypothetical protein [Synechocystis sp. PCC 7338]|uniref:hypothetical protein n=1 Tax=Synechocystis sp. PCC 7338 TaxID=2732530 RepID=UPI001BAFE93D|nr:hypothetical protein [Synechocystis sp. PCC 7338]QUS60362.1 hypothetical protein HTZ78_06530 [Synechocystis sp. PCC 7338]